jgi:Cu(I)/Ag(I) efflux system membrane protein CusA/SilA
LPARPGPIVASSDVVVERLLGCRLQREHTLLAAIREGAVLRVRPKAMTVAVVMAGLLPIMWSGGTGSELMTRIAAPMVGGMVSAPLLSMLVMPAAWYLLHRRRGRRAMDAEPPAQAPLG